MSVFLGLAAWAVGLAIVGAVVVGAGVPVRVAFGALRGGRDREGAAVALAIACGGFVLWWTSTVVP